MSRFGIAVLLGVVMLGAEAVGGQTTAASSEAPQLEPAKVFAGPLRTAGNAVVGLAEAFPEELYGFAPTSSMFVAGRTTEYKGVRTFAEQVAHVASSNYEYLNAMGLEMDKDPKKIEQLKTKAELMQALKDSYAAAQKAAAATTTATVFEGIGPKKAATRAAYLSAIAWHTMDHYGQMVEYARMNGIVPPQSR